MILLGAIGMVGGVTRDGPLDQEQRSKAVLAFPDDRSGVERFATVRQGHYGVGLHRRADSACRAVACRVPWRGEDRL